VLSKIEPSKMSNFVGSVDVLSNIATYDLTTTKVIQSEVQSDGITTGEIRNTPRRRGAGIAQQ